MDSLINQTDEAIGTVSTYIDDYDAFLGWINTATQDYESLEESEQAAFADAFTQFSIYTNDVIEPEEVDTVHDEFRNVLREPVLEAILESIEKIQSQLDITLSDSELDSFRTELESWPRERLIDCRSTHESLVDEVSELDVIEKTYVGGEIEDKPHRLLQPDTDVFPLIRQTKSKNQSLRKMTTEFEQYGWIDLPGHDVGPFPMGWFEGDVPRPETIGEILRQIDSSVQVLSASGIRAGSAISHELTTLVEQPSQEFTTRLRELANELDRYSEISSPLEHLPGLRDAVHEMDINVIDDSLLAEIEHDIEDSSINRTEGLSELIRECRDKYDQWTTQVAGQWQTYRSAVTVLTEDANLEQISGLDADREFKDALQEEPILTIKAFEELIITLDSYRENVGNGGRLSEEGVNLLFDLIESRNVHFSNYETETIEDLAKVIELQIVIDESE